MATSSLLSAKGLYTFPNYLSKVPEGAMILADNVNIDKDGVVEPRRGIRQYGEIGLTSADTAKQLLLYKDRVIAHYGSQLAWDDELGNFTVFTDTYSETESGLRIKSVESNGNLYITTSEGVKKIAATSAASLASANETMAGGIKAATGVGVTDYAGAFFMDGYSKVAYKITWGTNDINENFIEGVPSSAIEVTNSSPDPARVILTFQVPNGVTTDYFYRIYRTNVAIQPTTPTFDGIADLETGDEMRLVIENPYVSGTSITEIDETPEDFRNNGVNLYTNEFSGEGILQANEPPPFAKDIALYQGAVFYANTRTKHRSIIDLLGISNFQSFGGVTDSIDVSSISYSAPDTTITFSAAHGLVVGQKIVILSSGAASLDGIRTVATTPTTTSIIVVADGTGATATNVSVYGSSITIQRSPTPATTYYFVGRPEVFTVTLPAPASLNSSGVASYIEAYSIDDANRYVFWFKTGTAIDPKEDDPVAFADAISIEVDITAATTAAQVAIAFETAALTKTFDFTTTQAVSGAVVYLRTSSSGNATDATSSDVDIVITKTQDGHSESAANKYIRLSSFASPAQAIDETARSITRIITANPSEVVNAYYIFSPGGLPGRVSFEAKDLDSTPFQISSTSGASFSPSLATAESSSNDERGNRVYYSKLFQPEAVPLTNYFDIGPKEKQIKRVVALRDSLFIFKEEGIYRLTGEDPNNYTVTLFDNSANITAPDSAAILNNQIYLLTTQGVATVSDTGVQIISRPIENIFNKVSAPAFLNYRTIIFAATYESERSYMIWVPTDPADAYADKCYRFNTFTQTWTAWNVSAISAIVEPFTNRLYIGAADTNIVEIERKDFNRYDYADRQYILNIFPNAFQDTTVTLSSAEQVSVGDVLLQEQYVTTAQVERLAKKLAIDSGVPNTVGNSNKDYYRNFIVAPASNIQNSLSQLITQLNADLSSSFDTTYSSVGPTFFTEFNSLIASLNASVLLLQANYQGSTGSVFLEMTVTARINTTQIRVREVLPFLEGELTVYKAIPSQVIWAPLSFGEPSMMKHVREGVMLFDNASLSDASMGFNTDLSPNFEDIPFVLEGDGSFGVFTYSATTWGGEGSGRPFRTYIPRQKQRCRFIRPRFQHKSAFYRYGIYGVGFTYEITSEKAYR